MEVLEFKVSNRETKQEKGRKEAVEVQARTQTFEKGDRIFRYFTQRCESYENPVSEAKNRGYKLSF